MERILASFPRFVGAGFGSLTTETFCRAFSAVFGARVSKSVFSGTAVCDCVAASTDAASPRARRLQRMDPRSGKSERGALSAPVERKAGVGHKLVRGEIDGLFTVEDRRSPRDS